MGIIKIVSAHISCIFSANLTQKTLDTCFYLCYNLYITRAGELGLDFEGSW